MEGHPVNETIIINCCKISVEIARFSVLLSIEKAAISIEISTHFLCGFRQLKQLLNTSNDPPFLLAPVQVSKITHLQLIILNTKFIVLNTRFIFETHLKLHAIEAEAAVAHPDLPHNASLFK